MNIEEWILRSFAPPFDGVKVERCDRDGRRGLAVFSLPDADGAPPRFRHVLAWVWDAGLPTLFVIMLNPSTAGAFVDDQTMKKVFGFAKQNGYGGVVVVNQCDFRATKPAEAKKAGWPTTGYCNQLKVRVLNDLDEDEQRRDVLLAWGDNGVRATGWATGRKRDPRVRLLHLGLTKHGKPEHPCMLPYSRELTELAA